MMTNNQPANGRQQNHQGGYVVGMAYVPDQKWHDIYRIDYGFFRGTIFAELDKPWLAGGNSYE